MGGKGQNNGPALMAFLRWTWRIGWLLAQIGLYFLVFSHLDSKTTVIVAAIGHVLCFVQLVGVAFAEQSVLTSKMLEQLGNDICERLGHERPYKRDIEADERTQAFLYFRLCSIGIIDLICLGALLSGTLS